MNGNSRKTNKRRKIENERRRKEDERRKNDEPAPEWGAALEKALGENPPESFVSFDLDEIVKRLKAVLSCAKRCNAILPTGGWEHIVDVIKSNDAGCIELICYMRCAHYLCKPSMLFFEYVSEFPGESFFLLETEQLRPLMNPLVGAVDEELIRLPNGKYLPGSTSDVGCLGYDSDGFEIPIPKGTLTVFRKLCGKFLLVDRKSMLMDLPLAKHRKHSSMTASEIRVALEVAKSEGSKARFGVNVRKRTLS